jgi:3-deoxy-manno-octulosonate cytidylyltransferase (CMP-KDO synthetase)
MQTTIVIPARYASTRLPAKPLLRETGKYLIEHVYERALQVRNAHSVIVATDDARIRDAVRGFGGRVAMTRDDHPSGTDRIAEVAESLPEVELFINLQGDEPEFDPVAIDRLVELMTTRNSAMATLATPIRDRATYENPNCVKVVRSDDGRALYFSRSPIPHVRDGEPDFASGQFLLHLGVYAYRRETLFAIANSPPHPLEQAEKLEQLRMLAAGRAIQLEVIPQAHRGIDTPADYAAFAESYRRSQIRGAA